MIINDRVYGKVEITEPVLLELMESTPMQRLKHIDQHGARKYLENTGTVTRYEHCVGVMILLKLLGADLEEQIAGLLHDVPHTAFSHVVDYVFVENNDEHNFHESFFEKIVLNSEIPNILEKYGFDVKRVINEHLFSLLERSAPDLCADRLDYSFRDYLAHFQKEKDSVKEFVDHLIVHNKEIIFDDSKAAFDFARHFLLMDKNVWANVRSIASFYILAEAMRRGLEIKELSFDDLFSTDDEVMQKLQNSNDSVIQENLSKLRLDLEVEFCDEKDANVISMAKLRFVDPKVLSKNGELKRVGEIYPEYLGEIEEHKKITNGAVFLKVGK